MSDQLSEQALRSLETSKADLNDLLDEAARIVQTHYNSSTGKYAHIQRSKKNSYSFREQWVLKWLIRKIDDASQPAHDNTKDENNESRQFPDNPRLWALCARLLIDIPEQISIHVLLERSFTKTLLRSSHFVLSNFNEPAANYIPGSTGNNELERPAKRIRLSPDAGRLPNQDSQLSAVNQLSALPQYMEVLYLWASLLEPKQQISAIPVRTIVPAWSNSVEEAAQFLECVLASVNLTIKGSTVTDLGELSASTAIRWLRLWHSFAVSANTNNKTNVSKTFNSTCLRSCLGLHTKIISGKGRIIVEMLKEIQKCVALYTIVPLRSIFFAKTYHEPWQKHRGDVSWIAIEPLLKAHQSHLGAFLHVEPLANAQVTRLPEPQWAADLLSIASKLTPKDDAVTRQMESLWLEVFALCLMYLSYPRSIPKMLKDADGLLQPSHDRLPPSIQRQGQWPSHIVDALVAEEIQLSSSVQEYLVSAILAWQDRPIPISLLSKIVNLEPGLFIPDARNVNSTAIQYGLLLALDENSLIVQTDYMLVVHSILTPIWRAFARTRDYDGLLNMWLPRLEEASRVRASTTFSADTVPSALAWDDEDVFALFEELYQFNISPNLGTRLLSAVSSELENISERIGPTTDIFASVAILESILKSRITGISPIAEFASALQNYANLLIGTIQQQNDYQGQRWRLWSTLVTLFQIDPSYCGLDSLEGMIENTCERFHSSRKTSFPQFQSNKRAALLMEQQAIFRLLTEYCAWDNDGVQMGKNSGHMVFSQQMQALSETLKELGAVASANPAALRDTIWDGRINNLREIEQLVQVELGCILSKPNILDDDKDATAHLLSSLADVIGTKNFIMTKEHSSEEVFVELGTSYLLGRDQKDGPKADSDKFSDTKNQCLPSAEAGNSPHEAVVKRQTAHQAISVALSKYDTDTLRGSRPIKALPSEMQGLSVELEAAAMASTIILRSSDPDLQSNPALVKIIASAFDLREAVSNPVDYNTVLRLEQCLQALKDKPGMVNQAAIDSLLGDLTILTSSDAKFVTSDHSSSRKKGRDWATAIFDRVVAVVSVLLARYRRRLTDRTHLLLPMLQNLLKCFFYTPSRTYMYRAIAIGSLRQKQAFRSSLPGWLDTHTLSSSSAIKFTKIISSICNPTTASARSAHKNRRKSDGASMQLNDEIQKARRLAAQYMQYLLIEYTRCILDGVIEPEVREHLLPGVFHILDAMDNDLITAMNASMDPSGRAIFKDLYSEWSKHWRWNQS